MSNLVMLYSTHPNAAQAEKIAQLLVSAQLVACANLLPAITSIYRWEGKITKETEVAMLCKTTKARLEDAIALIREHHSYGTPAIVAVPIEAGDAAFMRWVAESCSPL